MIDNTITHEMIIKALECCSYDTYHDCNACPLNEPSSRCIPKLARLARAEIEELEHSEEVLYRVKEQLKETLTEREAEIERLKTNLKEAHIDIREHITRIESLKKSKQRNICRY